KRHEWELLWSSPAPRRKCAPDVRLSHRNDRINPGTLSYQPQIPQLVGSPGMFSESACYMNLCLLSWWSRDLVGFRIRFDHLHPLLLEVISVRSTRRAAPGDVPVFLHWQSRSARPADSESCGSLLGQPRFWSAARELFQMLPRLNGAAIPQSEQG